MKFSVDLLAKWFPNGIKSRFQSAPIGLIEEAIQASGGAGGTDHSQEIAALTARVEALETELALHDNNGKHWTQQQVDDRVAAGITEHKAADHKEPIRSEAEIALVAMDAFKDYQASLPTQ